MVNAPLFPSYSDNSMPSSGPPRSIILGHTPLSSSSWFRSIRPGPVLKFQTPACWEIFNVDCMQNTFGCAIREDVYGHDTSSFPFPHGQAILKVTFNTV